MSGYGCSPPSPAGRGRDRAGTEPPAAGSGAEANCGTCPGSGRAAPGAPAATSRRSRRSPGCTAGSPSIRGHHLHVLTTGLAKTHGEIVVEGLDAAGMLRQKGLTGARARRRGLSDSALGETRRQLAYKTGWYGSRLVVADRWYPSSKTCHACGHVQDIGWAEHWTCAGCGAGHQRDDNAAINLARYEPPAAGDSAVGPVGAAVKRRADRKTGPRPAGGDEARKGTSRNAGEPTPRRGADEMSTTAHSSATVHPVRERPSKRKVPGGAGFRRAPGRWGLRSACSYPGERGECGNGSTNTVCVRLSSQTGITGHRCHA